MKLFWYCTVCYSVKYQQKSYCKRRRFGYFKRIAVYSLKLDFFLRYHKRCVRAENHLAVSARECLVLGFDNVYGIITLSQFTTPVRPIYPCNLHHKTKQEMFQKHVYPNQVAILTKVGFFRKVSSECMAKQGILKMLRGNIHPCSDFSYNLTLHLLTIDSKWFSTFELKPNWNDI